MTDPLTWSPINLGRWAGTQVRIHYFLIGFVVLTILGTAISRQLDLVPETIAWLGLLLLALVVHELGHAFMAWWLGFEPEDVRLWPFGNLVVPSPTPRAGDNMLVAAAGPAASGLMVLTCWISVTLMKAHFIWNPFGNDKGTGAPIMLGTKSPADPFTLPWTLGWFGYLNWVILIVNFIPALPFDSGRMLRAYLAQSSVVPSKENLIPPLLARSFFLILCAVGLVRLILDAKIDGLTVIMLAVLIEWMVRLEARMIEDGGFFDEGVFGYDFSEGYTSLESSAAKVRPYRESALKRWRRRRSEVRRQRRLEQEAAEERRMDEILEKIYRDGRSSLTDEENRFLVRVSVKYKNKPRARD